VVRLSECWLLGSIFHESHWSLRTQLQDLIVSQTSFCTYISLIVFLIAIPNDLRITKNPPVTYLAASSRSFDMFNWKKSRKPAALPDVTPQKRHAKRLSKSPRMQSSPASSPFNETTPSPLFMKSSPFGTPVTFDDIGIVPQRPEFTVVDRSNSQLVVPTDSIFADSQEEENPNEDDVLSELHSTTSKDAFYRLKSTRSSTSNVAANSQATLPLDPKAIDVNAAVAILEQLRKTASPEDLVALRMYSIVVYNHI
jgi:hypothetical protein